MGSPREFQDEFQRPELSLSAIKAAIPAECFKKNMRRSVMWMVIDFLVWAAAVLAYASFQTTTSYQSLPLAIQYLTMFAYWSVSGFYMWCLFVVGHDCGHGTFSNSEVVNAICGHLTHGAIMTPFWPWALSHNRHHLHHNHVAKDYSHIWTTQECDWNETMANLDQDFAKRKKELRSDAEASSFSELLVVFLVPPVAWFLYTVVGIFDGNHYLPLPGRLWRTSTTGDKLRCLVSTSVNTFFLIVFYSMCDSFARFCEMYVGSWFGFAFCLYAVTFLQHHGEDTKVYDGSTWTFVRGAFETEDRTYGAPLDMLHHHISDCHLIHHLFFRSVPHYNLRAATDALQAHLNKNKVGHLRKHKRSTWWFLELFHVRRKAWAADLVSTVKQE